MKFRTLAEVALRSLFLEASWNHQGQQNLGLAAAVDPALKELYGPGEGLRQARLRALDFFNTNPLTGGLVIGVIIHLEAEVAAGRLAAEQRLRQVAFLSRSLAALGDALFWQSWLPLCSLAAVWLVLSLNAWWAPWLLPLLFCLPALPLRLGGVFLGCRRGPKVTDLLYRYKVMEWAQNVQRLVALLVGASTVILVYTKTASLADGLNLAQLWAVVTGIAFTVVLFRLLSSKTRLLAYWYPFVLLALATAVLAAWRRIL